jgi:hypothetical protein
MTLDEQRLFEVQVIITVAYRKFCSLDSCDLHSREIEFGYFKDYFLLSYIHSRLAWSKPRS